MEKIKVKKPERMNPGETAVLIALGMNRLGIERRELDGIAENLFVIPNLEQREFLYTHGKTVLLLKKGYDWLDRVVTLIRVEPFVDLEEDTKEG